MNKDTGLGYDDTQAPRDAGIPWILLVEDDAVGAAFMTDALAALPARVASATTLAEALRLTKEQAFDLYLIDAHLPDGLGSELLARLRAQGLRTPALAHTAETARSLLDALIDAGFEEVLIKPLSIGALQGAVRRFTGTTRQESAVTGSVAAHGENTHLSDWGEAPTDGKLPLWDDDAALRALNGRHAHVALMRQLFRGELPQQAQRIAAAFDNGDRDGARAELHKLVAGAGFVGAVRLAENARTLQARPDFGHARFQFEGTVRDTLNSLSDQATPASD